MSLVVAAIHDGDSITLVADTKVTWDGHERRTRHTFENAFPKIVLLREDLAVGVTGYDPHNLVNDIVAHRNEDVDSVLERLMCQVDAGFVVAALRPARLWVVEDGAIEERTSVGRAWAGDQAA